MIIIRYPEELIFRGIDGASLMQSVSGMKFGMKTLTTVPHPTASPPYHTSPHLILSHLTSLHLTVPCIQSHIFAGDDYTGNTAEWLTGTKDPLLWCKVHPPNFAFGWRPESANFHHKKSTRSKAGQMCWFKAPVPRVRGFKSHRVHFFFFFFFFF